MKSSAVINKAFAISPIDGRYQQQTQELTAYFSEFAFTKKRIFVELQYLIHLNKLKIIPNLTKKEIIIFDQIVKDFDEEKFADFKEIEKTTKHDIKAIEYYLGAEFKKKRLDQFIPFIHFGLTSDDINNLALASILKEVNKKILNPLLADLLKTVGELAIRTKNDPILARTHGQPAVPTLFGKEMANYCVRIEKQIKRLNKFLFEGKCNGAVGNYNSLHFVYPNVDWIKFSENFVGSLRLTPNLFTTQILPYDNWIEFFQIIALTNMIVMDLSKNIWIYIMLELLEQKKVQNEIGSSTMPQKVNPIDFENCEGNLEVAAGFFSTYLSKLSQSRLQRDLSDSTIRRTFGEALGYTLVGWKSCLRGLAKISLNKEKSKQELEEHWEVLSEAIQTYLRSTGDAKGYEKLKDLSRGKQMDQKKYNEIIKKLGINSKKFIKLKPDNYLGLAARLIERAVK